jgi:hypothetical protein
MLVFMVSYQKEIKYKQYLLLIYKNAYKLPNVAWPTPCSDSIGKFLKSIMDGLTKKLKK